MGVDLGAQRTKLGLAREHLDLQAAPLRLLRCFEYGEQVADRHRQQIEQHAESEQQRVKAANAAAGSGTSKRRDRIATQPRAMATQIADEQAAAVSAVATIRIVPVPASGMPRATYQAERQTNENATLSGRAIADAKNQSRPRCPASNAARRPPTSSQSSR